MNYSKIIKSLLIFFSIILSMFLISFVAFAWTGPPIGGTPPDCDLAERPGCNAPIHVGSNLQTKEGPLVIKGVLWANFSFIARGPAGFPVFTVRDATDTADRFIINETGDVRFTGTLQEGSVPWPRLTSFPTACTAGFVTGVGSGLSCSAVNLGTADVTGVLTADKGGTGRSSLTSDNLLVGAGTGAVNFLAPGLSAGQVVRSTGVAWQSATLGIGDTSGNLPWSRIDSFPVGCAANEAVRTIGQTLGCIEVGAGSIGGSGATNYIPLWSSSSSLTDSAIYQSGSNVGIGTTNTGARITLADHTTNTGGIRFRTAATAVDLYSRGSAILTTAANFEAGSYRVGTTEVITSGRILRSADGSAGAPAFSFSGQTNAGIFRPAIGVLGFSTAGLERMRIDGSGNVGIGTATPAANLDVIGTWALRGLGQASLDLGGNSITNVNKMTVATIDPIYNIGSERYATYAPFMIGGVKEETVGTINVDESHTIDFSKLEKGSNLWLFYQITDFGLSMERLQVFLTPGFRGDTWYTKNPQENTLTIYGSEKGEISYRLVADRFDHEKWGNLADPDDSSRGIVVEEK